MIAAVDEQLREDDADSFLRDVNQAVVRDAVRLNATAVTLDLYFAAYLRMMSRFGFFNFGPVNIDARLVENVSERSTPRRTQGSRDDAPPMSDDFVRFSGVLMEEVRHSGRRRIDELHFLLAFMRVGEGLPARVFGELGVKPEQVEEYARTGAIQPAPLERLFSPEEAAAYLNVHVHTVRAWIKSGRLRARRLAGQRALRITRSDLESVLEPLDGNESGKP